MNKKKLKKLALFGVTIVFLDQLTKILILKKLALYGYIEIIPRFFNIVHVQNPGGAFGFLADKSAETRMLMFLVVSMAAVALVLYFYKNTPSTHPWLESGLAMIFGGAVGNLIDRFRFGYVIDFLDFYVGTLHWPAFNVADSAICIGTAILIFHLLFNKMPE